VRTGLFAGGAEIVLEVVPDGNVILEGAAVRPLADGVAEVRITPASPVAVRVEWRIPCTGATAYWSTDSNEHRGLPPFWRRPRTASLARGAPVGCLVGVADTALCTFAAGEVVEPVLVQAGVVEETGEFGFAVEQRAGPDRALVLRLDVSGRHFAHTLAGVAAWWGTDGARAVPEVARMPAYSTWYAMQQHVDAAAVERQADLAARLGCRAIIVDDGWHTTDRGRGYGHVGEWAASPAAFPDPAGHVARVHDRGLAYLLWFALPFLGRHTALWDRMLPRTLAVKDGMAAAVLDPRCPAVRDLLVTKLAGASRAWGLDGLKIDFVDQFAVDDPPPPGPDADCATVGEGVRRLMAQLSAALPAGVLVELRQPYVSPGLWPYATMIRASDCPLSPAHNRQRTVDLRLVAGPLAVHADMMMWHPEERPERVAAQLINVLFAVPQISVDLAAQTPEQAAVLRFWLRFCIEHAAVLQHGVFEPSRPDLLYPLVRAAGPERVIAGRYAPVPVPFEPGRELLVANADDSTAVLLRPARPCTVQATVLDCQGRPAGRHRLTLDETSPPIEVPTGGLLRIAGAARLSMLSPTGHPSTSVITGPV
jgi:alpha-galactosidase